jgi:hypothetical protein
VTLWSEIPGELAALGYSEALAFRSLPFSKISKTGLRLPKSRTCSTVSSRPSQVRAGICFPEPFDISLMRVLLDQGTPVQIRASLPNHTVRTAHQQGSSLLSNGDLLEAAEKSGFDILLTTDTNLRFQQNMFGRKIAVVILDQARWKLIQLALPQVVFAIAAARPGVCEVVKIPKKATD